MPDWTRHLLLALALAALVAGLAAGIGWWGEGPVATSPEVTERPVLGLLVVLFGVLG